MEPWLHKDLTGNFTFFTTVITLFVLHLMANGALQKAWLSRWSSLLVRLFLLKTTSTNVTSQAQEVEAGS